VTWVKLDDGFADHPKIAGLDDRSFRLFVWCLCYSARHLTDGFVADRVLRRCPYGTRAARREVTLGHLAGTDLIERVEGGIQIHDFLVYNPNRASVLENRQRAAERKRRSRAKQKSQRHGVTKPGRVTPVTAHPTPSPKKGEGGGALEARRPPPETTCFVCERAGLPVQMHAGQWWCAPCLADYDRRGGQIELGQIEPFTSLAAEDVAP
jgi:hypothetical protein